jgi:hypothetical protein
MCWCTHKELELERTGSVGVRSLSVKTAGLDHVLVGGRGVATVAALVTVALVAVDDLLRSKADQLAAGEEPLALNSLSNAERPACVD